MTCYYNENDPYAAQWLRELIEAGLIANGEVDERSIADVQPGDLDGFTQCHFFAGIGGWSYALRLADWPDGLAVWTGSCPCQPFSVAGKRKGTDDKRHLWPEFHRLIAQRKPSTVFGEQVASKDGRGWLAGIRVDLEALGYGFGAADLCAASTGAPHIRQRLFWLADAECDARGARRITNQSSEGAGAQTEGASIESGRCCLPGGLEHSAPIGRQSNAPDAREHGAGNQSSGERIELGDRCISVGLGKSDSAGRQPWEPSSTSARYGSAAVSTSGAGRLVHANGSGCGEYGGPLAVESPHLAAQCAGGIGFWSQYDIIPCADGKARRIEPGSFPLAHGIPGRVGLLRGYGNAIVPQVAAQFIRAFRETKLIGL